ncbi:uncharacterized protein LOC143300541 [Babylonia areolata]|uniref:uncharacterized protein LOC143300541 n=1 Tax=Babylonia areolata TaxID=304850 RepID=UPI003FD4D5AA
MAAHQTTGPSKPTQPPPRSQLRKNLKCGICQDVYRCPKLLPCFHTYCRQCLEQLVAVRGSPFHCPSCRSLTHVPKEGGAGAFQTNMYITESELDRARESVALCRVHVSYDEPLTFFCVTCDDAICLRCKLTKHEGHRCEDLVKSDERGRRLARAKRELDDEMDVLEVKVSMSEDQLKQIQRKKAAVIQQIHARHDSLVSMANRWMSMALKDVEKSSEAMQTSVSCERDHLLTHLTTCRSHRKRVQEIVDNLSEDSLDVAEAERVLRICTDRDGLRKRLRMPSSETSILRPGLHCSVEVLQEDDVRRFIGIAAVLKVPDCGPAREALTLFYQCVEDGAARQVLALCVTNDGNVHCMYEEVALGRGSQWGKRTINPEALVLRNDKVSQRFIFRKFSGGDKFCIAHHSVKNGVCLNAKSGSLAQIQYQPCASGGVASCRLSDILVVDDAGGNQPKLSSHQFIQNVHLVGKPLAMDVTADSSLLAVLEEVVDYGAHRGEQAQRCPRRRFVRLYRRGHEDCIAVYLSPSPDSFLPTDVCFWRHGHGQEERLLVADYANDSVHVISVHVINAHKGRCVLERYLAAGHGDLVKPTAFDTDSQGRLWIGCATGWILKCEALPGTGGKEEDEEEKFDEDKTFAGEGTHSSDPKHKERHDDDDDEVNGVSSP